MQDSNKPKGEKDAEKEKRENAAASYGWSLSIMRSDPELKKIFDEAVDAGWGSARFIAEVRDTKWFKTHSDSWRQSELLRITDPKTYERKMDGLRATLKDNAAKMGAVLSDKQLQKISSNVMMFGWEESQQRDVLAGYIKTVNSGTMRGQYIGDAGRNADALRKVAENNGYRLPDARMQEWNRSIARGDRTVEDYQRFMRNQAAKMFPGWAQELAGDMDLVDVASPYMDSMAKILELNPNSLDLYDPTVRKAMAHRDPKTGKGVAMTMTDFEDIVRKDKRWQYTDNAHDQILGAGRDIARMMGVGI